MELVDTPLAQLVPLTEKEKALRAELEAQVFAVVKKSYIELGRLLAEIKERKLYKSSHHTFAAYSQDVLDMARCTAYRYIEANFVVNNLSPMGDKIEELENVNRGTHSLPLLPQNERQARALIGLSPEEQREVWIEAVKTAPEGKISAAHIGKTVRQLKGNRVVETIERTKREKAPNGARISDEFTAAFNVFKDAVQVEILSNWATTDRLSVVRHLDAIRGAISVNGNHKIAEKGYAITASNTEKLLDAGFNIIRTNLIHLTIEKLVGNSQWAVVEAFNDVENLNRAFDYLLLDLKNLRG